MFFQSFLTLHEEAPSLCLHGNPPPTKQTLPFSQTSEVSEVERVKSTKFLGVHLNDELTSSCNTTAVIKKAQQRLHFLRRLKRVELHTPALTIFYRGTIESVLTSWFGNSRSEERHKLNRTVRTAGKIIGASLPPLLDIHNHSQSSQHYKGSLSSLSRTVHTCSRGKGTRAFAQRQCGCETAFFQQQSDC